MRTRKHRWNWRRTLRKHTRTLRGTFWWLMMEDSAQRQQILLLESKVDHYKKQLEHARRASMLSRQSEPAEWRRTREANERLREENEELRDEIEEVKAMVEVLKEQRAGRTGLVHSPRNSPPL